MFSPYPVSLVISSAEHILKTLVVKIGSTFGFTSNSQLKHLEQYGYFSHITDSRGGLLALSQCLWVRILVILLAFP